MNENEAATPARTDSESSKANGSDEVANADLGYEIGDLFDRGVSLISIPAILISMTYAFELGFALQLGIPKEYISISADQIQDVLSNLVIVFWPWALGLAVGLLILGFILRRRPRVGVQLLIIFAVMLFAVLWRTEAPVLNSGIVRTTIGLAFALILVSELAAFMRVHSGQEPGERSIRASLHTWRTRAHVTHLSHTLVRIIAVALATFGLVYAVGVDQGVSQIWYSEVVTLDQTKPEVPDGGVFVILRVYGGDGMVAAPLDPDTGQLGEQVLVIPPGSSVVDTFPKRLGPLTPPPGASA